MIFKKMLFLGISILMTASGMADDTSKQDYEDRLARYDLEADPEKHKSLASWCRRNYPAKYSYHQGAYNLYQFSEFVEKMGNDPAIMDLQKARDYARKLELFDEAKDYHTRWGEAQYAGYSKRLEPGDVKMMKQLLAWTIKNQVDQIPSAQKLANSIIEAEPNNAEARKIIGHFQVEETWTSKEKLLDEMKISNVHDRIKVHKILAEARNRTKKSYPSRPIADLEQEEDYYLFSPRKSPQAKFYLHVRDYSRKKPCRLIISLHGGGSGGYEKASEYAGYSIKSWARANCRDSQVVLAPIATNHVVSSWSNRTNVMQILDAAEEICERFNIDRKKIYVTGQSMGGGGTCFWYLCFPEFAAASVARTGWFHHDGDKQKDCLKKPILLIQGGKDEQFRLDSREKFMELAPKRNGNATLIMHPEVGHLLSWADQEEQVLEFMAKYTNDIEPDWDVMRKTAQVWTK